MRLVLGIAALGSFIGYCYWRGRCAREKHVEVKEQLHRWEGEGGNVPTVATPTPQVTPRSSYPRGGSDARH